MHESHWVKQGLALLSNRTSQSVSVLSSDHDDSLLVWPEECGDSVPITNTIYYFLL